MDAPPSWMLELLNGEEGLVPSIEGLDNDTLTAVCDALPAPAPAPLSGSKRSSLGGAPGTLNVGDGDGSGDDSDDDGGVGPASKKAKQTARYRAKACREKERRGKINDRFSELAKLIDPGAEPRMDKPTILSDAIKFVKQMTAENHQLKMLNKFLEERVSHFERERGQNLYQQSLSIQGGGLLPQPTALGAAPPGHMPPATHGPSLGMPGASHQHMGMVPHAAGTPGASTSGYGVPGPSQAMMQQMVPPHPAALQQQQMQQQHQQEQMPPQQQEQECGPHEPSQPPQLATQPTSMMQMQQQQQPAAAAAAATVAPVAPDASLAYQGYADQGLKPQVLAPPAAMAAVSAAAAAPNAAVAVPPQQQQPHWVNPNMLDAAHDSRLRPPAA